MTLADSKTVFQGFLRERPEGSPWKVATQPFTTFLECEADLLLRYPKARRRRDLVVILEMQTTKMIVASSDTITGDLVRQSSSS